MGQAKGHAVKRNRPTAAAANRATTLAKVKAKGKGKAGAEAEAEAKAKLCQTEN